MDINAKFSQVYRSVKHNSLVSSLFEFAIDSKWFESSLKPIIICFFQLVISEVISESCDTDIDYNCSRTFKVVDTCF